jgi:hypothetical protein
MATTHLNFACFFIFDKPRAGNGALFSLVPTTAYTLAMLGMAIPLVVADFAPVILWADTQACGAEEPSFTPAHSGLILLAIVAPFVVPVVESVPL